MKKISKFLVLVVLVLMVSSLFACMGSDGTTSTGYNVGFDESKIQIVADSDESPKQTTYSYQVSVEQAKLDEAVAKLVGIKANVLYDYRPSDDEGNVVYVKLILKVKKEEASGFIANNVKTLNVLSSSVETIAVDSVLGQNIGFEKIDIEISVGSSSKSGSSDVILYVFLGLIAAVLIGSFIYKTIKMKKMTKKPENPDNAPVDEVSNEVSNDNSEDKGGDFFS